LNSRLKRWRKGLQKVAAYTGQQKITNYFEILNEITKLKKENNLLRSALDEMLNKYRTMNTDHSTNRSGELLSRMMKQESSQVRRNSNNISKSIIYQ
jgi:cell shape-determining protein MreC